MDMYGVRNLLLVINKISINELACANSAFQGYREYGVDRHEQSQGDHTVHPRSDECGIHGHDAAGPLSW